MSKPQGCLRDRAFWPALGLVVLLVFAAQPSSAHAQGWSQVVLPKVAGKYPSFLYDAACTSPRACIAIGNEIAERWNGRGWRFIPAPTPRNGASATAIACTSMRACTAVGGGRHKQHGVPVIKRWDGRRWFTQPSPDPNAHPSPGLGLDSGLRAVSCPSARACMAVGQSGYNGNHRLGWALAEHWNGARWSIVSVPRPSGAKFSELASVSCSSPRVCTAVGDYLGSSADGMGSVDLPLVVRFTGGRWSLQTAANPGGDAGSTLGGVSCTAGRRCTAVGSSASGTVSEQPLVEAWDGSRWSVAPTPLPAPASQGRLDRVSCLSARLCAAVGGYRDGSTGGLGPMGLTWDGTQWSARLFPAPDGIMTKTLLGVSCPSAGWCMAVGNALAEKYLRAKG